MTLITATTRLSRELRQEYDRAQLTAGRSSWPTAHILPFTAWLSQVWDDWLYNGRTENARRLLRPSEERVIWEDIVRSQANNLLLEVPATTDAALDAWNLRCAWNLPLDASEWTDSDDSETFQVWALEFARRLSVNGWLSGAELPAFIADRIDEGSMPVPERVEIAGFLEPTPVQKRLFASLVRRGTEVEERKVPDSTHDAVRVGMIDGDREIRAAAEWARRILESDAEAAASEFRIGIIVPDLARCRSRVERVFAEEFHPRGHLRPELDARRLFNISLGPPLSEYPVIEASFLILGTAPQEIPIEVAGRLLRSPFIQGADEELTSRALLDGVLRSSREPSVSLADILGLAEKDDVPYRCPRLAAQLRMWWEGRKNLESPQMPSDWAPALSRLLQAIGWPGDGGLSSAQYQTMAAWNELLSEFAGLDSVAGRVSLPAAVGMLHHLAVSRQFQPESDPAPVQILGVFEASGLQFDRLWIMGMHDGAWPASTGPDPFLPFRLQRRYDLPRSSPDRELEFTEALTARLLASAPAVVVSYPQREDDSDLRVSPLFSTLPDIGADELGLRFPVRYVEQVLESSRLETLEDHNGPPCGDAALGGGTSLFQLQATCPFKAFAELRLGAKALDQSGPGLSALDRGQLIHRVLDRIWKQLGSHEGLLSTGDDRLAAAVRMTVGAEIHDLSRRRRALRRRRFAAIEQARLEGVITGWLTLEKERKPFTVLEQEESRRVSVGGIDVRIRMDRVDLLEDGGLVILDYKTGECSPADWVGPRPDEPQLPIYAVTADSPVAGLFFGRLKTGKVGFRGLAESEGLVPGVKVAKNGPPLRETIEDWRAVLNQLGDDFREGRAAVDPKDRRLSCRHCTFPTLCRINEAEQFPDDSGSADRGSEGDNG
jgi:ATP-dependent helicase/nuclease subunit B